MKIPRHVLSKISKLSGRKFSLATAEMMAEDLGSLNQTDGCMYIAAALNAIHPQSSIFKDIKDLEAGKLQSAKDGGSLSEES